jgi:hypothetical protein
MDHSGASASDLIKGITSDHQLIELADRLNIHLDGILDLSEIKSNLPKNKTYIILLQSPEGGTGHWVCVSNGIYFDSMGENCPVIFGLREYNNKQYQSTYREFCGIWCLLWLYCKQNNRMELFDQFHDLNNRDFE